MIGYSAQKGHGPFLVSKIDVVKNESSMRIYRHIPCMLVEASYSLIVQPMIALMKIRAAWWSMSANPFKRRLDISTVQSW